MPRQFVSGGGAVGVFEAGEKMIVQSGGGPSSPPSPALVQGPDGVSVKITTWLMKVSQASPPAALSPLPDCPPLCPRMHPIRKDASEGFMGSGPDHVETKRPSDPRTLTVTIPENVNPCMPLPVPPRPVAEAAENTPPEIIAPAIIPTTSVSATTDQSFPPLRELCFVEFFASVG